MKYGKKIPAVALVLFMSLSLLESQAVQAMTYDTNTLPYHDRANFDAATAVSVSMLTKEHVLEGHPDGTYRADDFLNRAEFITIIMRMAPDDAAMYASTNCFVDVTPSSWYAKSVCRAKALGYVRGNSQEDVAEEHWRYEPARRVQYEEAVKILMELYAFPTYGSTEGDQWYVPYIRGAHDLDIDLKGMQPGYDLTRGEMARLTARFMAQAVGELGLLDAAINAEMSASHSSSSQSNSSMNNTSSSSSASMDTAEINLQSRVILLGDISPVIASVDIMSTTEAIDIQDIIIEIIDPAPFIDRLNVYDENGTFIGRATIDGGIDTRFRLHLAPETYIALQDRKTTFYVRAMTRSKEEGGASGESFQVSFMRIAGTGMWSQSLYAEQTSDAFPEFITHARITSAHNGGLTEDTLLGGTNRTLAEFDFAGTTGENNVDLAMTNITFTIEQIGNVSLDDIRMRRAGTNTYTDCTNNALYVYCQNIPAPIGNISSNTTIQLLGDVSIPDTSTTASLRLIINDSGSINSSGAISWTDGTTVFTWVDIDSPVVRSTLHRR